jgi:hypothetical protein
VAEEVTAGVEDHRCKEPEENNDMAEKKKQDH